MCNPNFNLSHHDPLSHLLLPVHMPTKMPLDLLSVPTPGFGAMGLSHSMGTSLSLAQAEPLLLRALELGCTFWDTAVLYGAGVNESLLGDFIRKHNLRDKVFGARASPTTIAIC
jgi:diketogulonate reductase-like aldo/keto reductase